MIPWSVNAVSKHSPPRKPNERPRFSTQGPILIRKLFFSQERDLLKRFLWTQKSSFKKAAETVLPESSSLLAQNPRYTKKPVS